MTEVVGESAPADTEDLSGPAVRKTALIVLKTADAVPYTFYEDSRMHNVQNWGKFFFSQYRSSYLPGANFTLNEGLRVMSLGKTRHTGHFDAEFPDVYEFTFPSDTQYACDK